MRTWNERRDWHTQNKVIKDRTIEDEVVVIKNRVIKVDRLSKQKIGSSKLNRVSIVR
jgi:hypothetical protein